MFIIKETILCVCVCACVLSSSITSLPLLYRLVPSLLMIRPGIIIVSGSGRIADGARVAMFGKGRLVR